MYFVNVNGFKHADWMVRIGHYTSYNDRKEDRDHFCTKFFDHFSDHLLKICMVFSSPLLN